MEDRGISFDDLVGESNKPDADPFDLLCHIAYNAPLRTRRERAEMLRKEKKDFFEQYGTEAREVLAAMLDQYIEYGTAAKSTAQQLGSIVKSSRVIPEILKVPPISERGQCRRSQHYSPRTTPQRTGA